MSETVEHLAHWTQRSIPDFIYSISSDFMAQLETKMEKAGISRSQLAARLERSSGRVSQVFNNPGNLSLRVIVEYAMKLGMKVSIVAYDDGDPRNDKGPINPNIFVESWRGFGCPSDLFEVREAVGKYDQAIRYQFPETVVNYSTFAAPNPHFVEGGIVLGGSYRDMNRSSQANLAENWRAAVTVTQNIPKIRQQTRPQPSPAIRKDAA